MDSEICVFPQFLNAIRSPFDPAISAGNNFYLEIHIFAKHSYTCGDNIVEECHFATMRGYKYNSLSWDSVDRDLLTSDFPYPLEKVKWNGAEILKSKDDLIQQILEFARAVQNVTPPFQNDDVVYVSLAFVKKVFVSPQEFELTKAKILFNYYESIAHILWEKVREEINGLGHGSSLYEEFQSLEAYVAKIVRDTTNWRTNMYFDENYERVLIESLTEVARIGFKLLPAVTSRMQFLQRVHLSKNELIDNCSICMSGYLHDTEAYSLPCNHSFHFGCIETWLLKKPSCPICRFKLPITE